MIEGLQFFVWIIEYLGFLREGLIVGGLEWGIKVKTWCDIYPLSCSSRVHVEDEEENQLSKWKPLVRDFLC